MGILASSFLNSSSHSLNCAARAARVGGTLPVQKAGSALQRAPIRSHEMGNARNWKDDFISLAPLPLTNSVRLPRLPSRPDNLAEAPALQ